MKLFIDIETVPAFPELKGANAEFTKLYMQRFGHELENNIPEKHDNFEDHFTDKAGLYAEFGKIVCVSMGYIQEEKIKLKSFCSDNEKQILEGVAQTMGKATSLVAHNGKDFDYPWLCRRMIVNGVPLPTLLQIQNLKPWEVKLEDTVDLWRFGQLYHKPSLAILCYLFGIPSPKGGMDGSKVQDVFYKEKNYQKISDYCEGDVVALVNVYRKMNYQSLIERTLL
jgi:predicted PolB exonuclease-like 3'-5' exonuclease